MDDPDVTVPVPRPTPRGEGANGNDDRITESGVQGLFEAVPSATPSASRQWLPPTVEQLQRALPQYEITQFIACGGMGAVYMGTQKTLKRLVAIKVLPPEIEDGEMQYAERFKREAQSMARLSHPNIVAVYDAGEVQGSPLAPREEHRVSGSSERTPGPGDVPSGGSARLISQERDGYRTTPPLLYFVMEFIEGTDVHRLIASEGRLDPQRAMSITIAVCDALAFAHEEGIIHRDIKPSNIMLDKKGRVKVADFGLAKTISLDSTLLTGSNVAMGTADFIAPEALIAGALVDQRADLYAVGVMLYQMLTGRVPRGRFQLPSGIIPQIDPRLDAIVDKAMQTDRERRYSSALEMKADVEAVAAPVAMPSTVGALPGSVGLRSAHSSSLPSGEQVGSRLEDGAPWGRRALIAVPIAAVLAVIAFLVFKPPERDGTTRSGDIPAPTGTTASAVPPGYAWQRVFQDKEKDGWILVNEETIRDLSMTMTDGAVRLELASNSGRCALFLREHHQLGCYEASHNPNAIALRFKDPSSVEKQIELAQYPLPPRNSSGTDRFEFRAFGTRLTVLWNGVVVGTTEHDAIKAGGFGIYGRSARVRNIEVLRPMGTPVAGAFVALKKPVGDDVRSLTPPIGTRSTEPKGGGAQGLVTSSPTPAAPIKVREEPKPAVSASPAPQTSVSSLSPTGWTPLFTKQEWEKNWDGGESDYRGSKVKPSREFKDGLLHVRHANFFKPQPSPDGAIRAQIVIREGSSMPGITARNSGAEGSYQLSVAADGKSIRLTHFRPDAITPTLLGKYDLPKSLQTGDKVLLELRVVGDQLTGLLNGSAVILARDDRLKAAGIWGIDAGDGWFESVEVQPLPDAAVSKSPPLPVSASADKFPPGQWVKVFTKFEDLPEDLRKPDSGVKFEDGWLRFGVQPVKPVFLPTELQRNYAVRCRFKRNTDTGGSSGLILRNGLDDRGQLSFYSFDISPTQEILLKRKDGDKYPAIFNRKATAVELANPEETIEFGVVGERLMCRIGASLVKLITDTHIKQGKGYIAAGGASAVRDIEVINLDGLPEAEALRIIGVDEKGNDLRGKTGALSPSPSLPISPSSSFPPGQWVRTYKQSSDINQRWFDAGATLKDGWITPGAGLNQMITLGAVKGQGRNWGARAKFRWGGGYANIILRRTGSSTDNTVAGYDFRVSNQGAEFRRSQGRISVGGSDHKPLGSPSPVTLTEGQEVLIEAFAIGDTLYGRVEGKVFTMKTDGVLKEGGFEVATQIMPYRDIEFINLDGLPEAEALKAAGVEVKK